MPIRGLREALHDLCHKLVSLPDSLPRVIDEPDLDRIVGADSILTQAADFWLTHHDGPPLRTQQRFQMHRAGSRKIGSLGQFVVGNNTPSIRLLAQECGNFKIIHVCGDELVRLGRRCETV